jgi:hypothetical protein
MSENLEVKLVKAKSILRPEWTFYEAQLSERAAEDLLLPYDFNNQCARVCTRLVTLLPKTRVNSRSGIGLPMLNIDGFRYIHAYIISDPLNSTLRRGFSLELSFALSAFVPGAGYQGETGHFFNFDSYYDPGNAEHRLLRLDTSDLTSTGGLPWIGGSHLAHILRAPVMGPYVRALAFNEDTMARDVEIRAYLTT